MSKLELVIWSFSACKKLSGVHIVCFGPIAGLQKGDCECHAECQFPLAVK